MKILLTNDDGIDAPGINALAKELQENGHQIITVAPDKEQSATSHSITLHQPLRIIERGNGRFAVTGSPADCVILAAKVIVKTPVDLVISGINGGQNMGEDVLYSGTVAAALEAMFMGFKAIAVSLASYKEQKFHTAAFHIHNLLKSGLHELIDKNEIFNINVPNVEKDEIGGIRITHTGHRRYKDFVAEQRDPRGRKIYWIGGDNALWENDEGSDSIAVLNNHISITPLSPTFTKYDSFEKLQNWKNKRKMK